MRRHATLWLAAAATLVVTSACLPGGDDADSPAAAPGDATAPFDGDPTSTDPITLVTFGAPTARPLAPLVIRHPSIGADDDITVRFEGGDVPVEVAGRSMTDGEVMVLAPPLIDQTTGTLTTGRYEVSMAAAPAASIPVTPSAHATTGPPGTFLREFVAQIADDLDASTPAFQSIADLGGENGAEFRDSTQAVVADLRAAVAHFDEHGSFPVTTVEGPAELAGADLILADQLLSSYVYGLLDWLATETGPSSFAGAGLRAAPARASTEPGLDIEGGIKALREMMATIDNGSTIFTAIVGMSVTIGALLVKTLAIKASAVALVATSTTILFGMLAVIGTGLVVGPAAEGVAAIEAHLQGGNSEFGPELWTRVSDALADFGLTLGAEIHPVLNAATFTYAGTKAIVAFHGLICAKDDLPPKWIEWCNDQQAAVDAAAAAPLAIRRAWFRPHRIEPGDEGRLYVEIEPGPASPATATIDWGDGSPPTSVPGLDAGEIVVREHTFAPGDDGDRVVTISITATDADGNEAIETTKVLVSPGAAVTIDSTATPTRPLTRDVNRWEFSIAEGRPDYTVLVDFGDGTVSAPLKFSSTGTFGVDHAYDQPGQYPMRVDVTDGDGDGDSASLALTVDVRDPVEISSITGPTALDIGEDGTWTVQIEQGWPPFAVEIGWDDGGEPFRITTSERQVEATHWYSGEGQYAVGVFVEDAVPLGAASSTTVDVPRPPITFVMSGVYTCRTGDSTDTAEVSLTGVYDSMTATADLTADRTGKVIVADVADSGTVTGSGTINDAVVSTWNVSGRLEIDLDAGTATGSLTVTERAVVDDDEFVCSGTFTG